jgi:hypothetical protein
MAGRAPTLHLMCFVLSAGVLCASGKAHVWRFRPVCTRSADLANMPTFNHVQDCQQLIQPTKQYSLLSGTCQSTIHPQHHCSYHLCSQVRCACRITNSQLRGHQQCRPVHDKCTNIRRLLLSPLSLLLLLHPHSRHVQTRMSQHRLQSSGAALTAKSSTLNMPCTALLAISCAAR